MTLLILSTEERFKIRNKIRDMIIDLSVIAYASIFFALAFLCMDLFSAPMGC